MALKARTGLILDVFSQLKETRRGNKKSRIELGSSLVAFKTNGLNMASWKCQVVAALVATLHSFILGVTESWRWHRRLTNTRSRLVLIASGRMWGHAEYGFPRITKSQERWHLQTLWPATSPQNPHVRLTHLRTIYSSLSSTVRRIYFDCWPWNATTLMKTSSAHLTV